MSLPDQKEASRGTGCQFHSYQRTCRVLDVSRRACILFWTGLEWIKVAHLEEDSRREQELKPEQLAGEPNVQFSSQKSWTSSR